LDDHSVDDMEIRSGTRVFQVSLRPLTDDIGRVSGAIGCLSDVTDSVQLRRTLELRATVDKLTRCLNRAATLELLDLLLSVRAIGDGVAVVYVDLDQFKAVNDCFGHATGDAILAEAARRLRNAVKDADAVGRLGGDEFLVVCPGVASTCDSDKFRRR